MDIFIEHIIGWVYVDSLPAASRVPKCKRKFDILFVKKIQSKAKQKKKKKKKTKQNHILPVTIENVKFYCSTKHSMVPF